MKQHVLNAFYGVLDYAAYPAAMILAAPMLLRTLGAGGYGLWAVMTAVISGGAILASGFGDANIQYLSQRRNHETSEELSRVVRGLFGINLALGGILACLTAALAPIAASRLAAHDVVLWRDCFISLELAAVQLLLRAIESVCISTQRAFERYGAAVRVSIVSRVFSILLGSFFTFYIPHVSVVLLCGTVLSILSVVIQLRQLRRSLNARSLRPSWNLSPLRSLFGFGMYSWLLAASGVVFAQLDRIMLGLWLGGASLAAYALCAQLAQPVNGLVSSALHFVFPYLSSRSETHSVADQRTAVVLSVASNALIVLVLAFGLQAFGDRVLNWLGHGGATATSARSLFSPVLWSSALVGLSVTPAYVLYALNRIRTVVWFNSVGGLLSILLMPPFIRSWGIHGAIFARLPYVGASVLLYLPMISALRSRRALIPRAALLCEDV